MTTPTMIECVQQVRALSKDRLNEEALRLTRGVKTTNARLVAHLSEIDRRKLPLEWGYSSLFEYCTSRLKMSEAAAWLRIQVARICQRFPQVLDALADGRLTLTVAGRIASALTPNNVDQVLSDCSGMGRREADEYLTRFKPRPSVNSGFTPAGGFTGGGAPFAGSTSGCDNGRQSGSAAGGAGSSPRVGSPSPTGDLGFGHSQDSERDPSSQNDGHRDPSRHSPPLQGSTQQNGDRRGGSSRDSLGEGSQNDWPADRGRPPSDIQPARPGWFNVHFPAGLELKEKIVRLGEVLGVTAPDRNLEKVISRAVEIALDQKDPQRTHERRQKRKEQRAKKAAEKARKQAERSTPDASSTRSCRKEPVTPTPSEKEKRQGETTPQSEERPAKNALSRREEQAPKNCATPPAPSRPNHSRPTADVEPGDDRAPSELEKPQHSPPAAQPSFPSRLSDLNEPLFRLPSDRYESSSRTIPVEIRDLVKSRAKHQCEFVSRDGRRCTQRTRLEIDHIEPFGKGGEGDLSNLRFLCRAHNLWEAGKHFGAEFMQHKAGRQ